MYKKLSETLIIDKPTRCGRCGHPHLVKGGVNSSGNQIWSCSKCKFRSTYRKLKKVCSVCGKPYYARGLCYNHYFTHHYNQVRRNRNKNKNTPTI